jgi:hypothetical protein
MLKIIFRMRFEAVCSSETAVKKEKQSHNTAVEAQGGERMYSSYSFMTSALDGSEWSASLKHWYIPTCLHGVTSQKTNMDIFSECL